MDSNMLLNTAEGNPSVGLTFMLTFAQKPSYPSKEDFYSCKSISTDVLEEDIIICTCAIHYHSYIALPDIKRSTAWLNYRHENDIHKFALHAVLWCHPQYTRLCMSVLSVTGLSSKRQWSFTLNNHYTCLQIISEPVYMYLDSSLPACYCFYTHLNLWM